MNQSAALAVGKFLQDAARDLNARLTEEQACIVALYEIIAVDQEQR